MSDTILAAFRKLHGELDKALEKVENQRARIAYLEGAAHHATGTPLTKAKDEIRQLNQSLQEKSEATKELMQQLAAERALADRLAETLERMEVNWNSKAWHEWKEARK
jgi:predicted RNase H-like nuclease (RuvC/YqgF family)